MLKGLLITLGVVGGLYVISWFLPDEKMKKWGKNIGRIISKFLILKIGAKFARQIEDFCQGKIRSFFEGLNEGLDADDQNGG